MIIGSVRASADGIAVGASMPLAKERTSNRDKWDKRDK